MFEEKLMRKFWNENLLEYSESWTEIPLEVIGLRCWLTTFVQSDFLILPLNGILEIVA